MAGVQREKNGDSGAGPERGGEAAQDQEEQGGIRGMEQGARQMVPPRTHAVYLTVQNVAEPREWMPVSGAQGSEGPRERRPGKAALNVGFSVT